MATPAYLNADLEIDSTEDLQLLVEAFSEDVHVMYCGEWGKHYRAAFEVAHCSGVNQALHLFCALVESLEGKERVLWDQCLSKVIDLGFDSGDTSQYCNVKLDPDVVARVAAAGMTLAVTVYPIRPEDR